jgi:hypothetical protein
MTVVEAHQNNVNGLCRQEQRRNIQSHQGFFDVVDYICRKVEERGKA